MKILILFASLFISYELLKIIMVGTYWRLTLKLKEQPILRIMEYLYLIFLIILLLTQYWYIGGLVFLVSLVTAYRLAEPQIKKSEVTTKIKTDLIIDSVISILALGFIIFKSLI